MLKSTIYTATIRPETRCSDQKRSWDSSQNGRSEMGRFRVCRKDKLGRWGGHNLLCERAVRMHGSLLWGGSLPQDGWWGGWVLVGKDYKANPNVRRGVYEGLGKLTLIRDMGEKPKLSTGSLLGKREGKMWGHSWMVRDLEVKDTVKAK